MDLTAIIAHLSTMPEFAQVVEASSGVGGAAPLNVAAELVTLLDPLVGGEVYPIDQHDQPEGESIVYQRMSEGTKIVDGYHLTNSAVYVLFVRAISSGGQSAYDRAKAIEAGIKSALEASTVFAFEIDDAMDDYVDETRQAQINLSVEVSSLAESEGGAAQSFPALYVYAVRRTADRSEADNLITQRVRTHYAFNILTKNSDVPALADALMAKLLGFQQTAQHFEFEYLEGAIQGGVAGLQIWQELYEDSIHIDQQTS